MATCAHCKQRDVSVDHVRNCSANEQAVRGIGRRPEPEKARCYQEFCCDEATLAVEVQNRSGNPALEPIPWGYCPRHYTGSWQEYQDDMGREDYWAGGDE